MPIRVFVDWRKNGGKRIYTDYPKRVTLFKQQIDFLVFYTFRVPCQIDYTELIKKTVKRFYIWILRQLEKIGLILSKILFVFLTGAYASALTPRFPPTDH